MQAPAPSTAGATPNPRPELPCPQGWGWPYDPAVVLCTRDARLRLRASAASYRPGCKGVAQTVSDGARGAPNLSL